MGENTISFFYKHLWVMFNGYDITQYMATLLFFGLMAYRWQEKPILLRHGMWLLPLSFALFLQFGWPQEYRHCQHRCRRDR